LPISIPKKQSRCTGR